MPRSVVIDDPSLNSPFDEPTRHFQPGPVKRYDNAYARNGVASLFLAFGPLAGWRRVAATDTRARGDRAHFIRDLLDGRCKAAEKVVLVMDQLGTHWVASLYEVFDPAEARRPAERLEARLTPEHGSSTPARTPKQRPRRRQALPANRKRRLHTRDRTKGISRPGRPSSESRRRTGGARSGAVRRGLGRSGGDNRTEARRKRPGNPGLSSGDMCRHIRPVRPTGVEPVTCGSEDHRPPPATAYQSRLTAASEESVCTTGCTSPANPDLARVIAAWPTLPEPIRRAVLALVAAGEG
jgi:DDE superfamily endonuclease